MEKERLPVLLPSNILPRLQLATFKNLENSEVEKEYKSGAVYKGTIVDNRRAGQGVFTWPDGARYEGQFVDNVRNGQGEKQKLIQMCFSIHD